MMCSVYCGFLLLRLFRGSGGYSAATLVFPRFSGFFRGPSGNSTVLVVFSAVLAIIPRLRWFFRDSGYYSAATLVFPRFWRLFRGPSAGFSAVLAVIPRLRWFSRESSTFSAAPLFIPRSIRPYPHISAFLCLVPMCSVYCGFLLLRSISQHRIATLFVFPLSYFGSVQPIRR